MSAVRSLYTKGDFYMSGRIVPDIDNVVSERDEAKHKAMKAKMTPGVRLQTIIFLNTIDALLVFRQGE